MQRTLVVYYSLGGNTAQVARDIAQAMSADLDAIEDAIPRRGGWWFARSCLEAVARGLPAIQTRRDPRSYDLVVLGTPVWAGTMASPLRSFLFSHAASLQRVACFCTMAGRGGPNALTEIMSLCGAQSVPAISFTQSELGKETYRAKLDEYVQDLRALTRTPAAA